MNKVQDQQLHKPASRASHTHIPVTNLGTSQNMTVVFYIRLNNKFTEKHNLTGKKLYRVNQVCNFLKCSFHKPYPVFNRKTIPPSSKMTFHHEKTVTSH